jgi:acyl-CoA synthetase (AMP-forming)/AMP-acid ligase II
VPHAEVVLSSGCDLDAVRAHCARLLSSYKVPLEFIPVEAIPRTPAGKILRHPSADDTASVAVEHT